jgi:hypothetical protein
MADASLVDVAIMTVHVYDRKRSAWDTYSASRDFQQVRRRHLSTNRNAEFSIALSILQRLMQTTVP